MGRRYIRYIIGVVLVLSASHLGFGQAKQIISKISSNLNNTIILPTQDNSALIKTELKSQIDGRPVHFAKGVSVNITPETHGKWEEYNDSELQWHLIIQSPNAYSLNLGFNNFKLPESSLFYISNKSGSDIKGPFTEKDNKEHKEFWSPLVRGDEIYLILIVPFDKKEELQFNLTKVSHDYLDFSSAISGDCNLDVICGEEDGFEMVDQYRDIIRSVGAYHINGVATCTGALINNTRQDKTPYFLTADHCGVNSATDASIVVYWNYENSYCRELGSSDNSDEGDGSFDQFNMGSILRASGENTDFTLLELNSPVPDQFNPFYAGWNAEDVYPSEAICIHHPGVEEKRISFEFDQLTSNNSINYIYVSDWDIGTTEGGSSGSPLFNNSKQIIGQLRGGQAACTNDLFDRFGRMARSWLGNNTVSGSLKPWLDPDNTGVLFLDGFEGDFLPVLDLAIYDFCNSADGFLTLEVTTSNAYQNFINIEVEDLPNGVNLLEVSENITPGEIGEIRLEIPSTVEFGSYVIKVTTTDGMSEGTVTARLNIDNGSPSIVDLIFPQDEFSNASTSQNLEWSEENQTTYYQLEVSESEDFTSLVFQQDFADSTTGVVTGLEEESTYFWRVKTINTCGESDWSEVFSFTTSSLFCLSFKSEGPPLELPEAGLNTINSDIFIDYPLVVDDVNILNLDISHTYISDLDIVLYAPDNQGTSILMQSPCDNHEDIFIGFDDQSGLTNYPCPPLNGDSYKPESPLSNLFVNNTDGPWTLQVNDTYNLDGGQLNSWEIELCFSGVTEALAINLEPEKFICAGQEAIFRIYYDTKGQVINTATLENLVGESIDFDDSFLPLQGSGVLDLRLNNLSQLDMGEQEIYLNLGLLDETKITLHQILSSEITSFSPDINGVTTDWIGSFNWEANNSDGYIAEIADDENFQNIIWSEEFSSSTNSFNGPIVPNGEYYFRMSSFNACSQFYTSTYNFIIEGSVNTTETILNHLEIFPNPTDNSIIIDGNIDYQNVEVGIYDISGKRIRQFNFRGEKHFTDVSQLKPGVYLIELELKNVTTVEKLIIF